MVAGGLDEARRGVDRARGADRDEQVGPRQRPIDHVHGVGHLTEEHDVGSDRRRAAGVAHRARRHVPLPHDPCIAGRAQRGLQLTVHVEQPLRPGLFMQIVDILGDDQQLPRPFRIEPGERAMCGVGLDRRQRRAAGVVEAVDEIRILRERLGRADVLHTVPLPQAARAAEGRKAALSRDAGAGEDDDGAHVGHPPLLAEDRRAAMGADYVRQFVFWPQSQAKRIRSPGGAPPFLDNKNP